MLFTARVFYVYQVGNKSSAVTINAFSGQITTTGNKISSGSSVSFVVNNSVITATDVPFVVIASGATTARYRVQVDGVTNGTFTLTINNVSGANMSETLVLNFVIFRGN